MHQNSAVVHGWQSGARQAIRAVLAGMARFAALYFSARTTPLASLPDELAAFLRGA